MSVGIGIVGRQILMTIGAQTILGVQSKGGDRANTVLETTDDQASGWSEKMAISGEKSVSRPVSGVLKNLELLASYYSTSQMFNVVFTYPDGSTETGDFFLENFSATGEHGSLSTFDATFTSSGEVVFVAGT